MEYIVHNRWKQLADAEYSDKNPVLPPNGSIVFVHMEHIYQFFKDVERTDNKYVLISADSDYSLCVQAQHPVWFDMRRWLNFVPVDETQGYSPVMIPSRCFNEFCRIDDTFSTKVYSFTKATFNKIPENILYWFSTNVDFNYPGIEHIPFGIPEWNLDKIDKMRGQGEHENGHGTYRKYTYVNFQTNTIERSQLKEAYRNRPTSWYIHNSVSHDEYVEDLFEMKYVISPPGNGFDCFRTLEAIYCGAIPILKQAPYNTPYKFLSNTIMSEDMISWPDRNYINDSLNNTTADFGFWRKRVEEKREMLKELT